MYWLFLSFGSYRLDRELESEVWPAQFLHTSTLERKLRLRLGVEPTRKDVCWARCRTVLSYGTIKILQIRGVGGVSPSVMYRIAGHSKKVGCEPTFEIWGEIALCNVIR